MRSEVIEALKMLIEIAEENAGGLAPKAVDDAVELVQQFIRENSDPEYDEDGWMDIAKRRIRQARRIFASDREWEDKYDAIFNLGIWQAMRNAGEPLPDYADPDTTYQEDVTAYMQAIEEWATLHWKE